MIQEARIYDTRKLSVERQRERYGLRVLTTRKWLQGISKRDIDIWLPDAGPSVELLEVWRAKEIPWTTFVDRYEQEQREYECSNPVKYIDGNRLSPAYCIPTPPVLYLARKACEGLVTVLCWEQGEQCHRHTMVRLVQEQLTVKERV